MPLAWQALSFPFACHALRMGGNRPAKPTAWNEVIKEINWIFRTHYMKERINKYCIISISGCCLYTDRSSILANSYLLNTGKLMSSNYIPINKPSPSSFTGWMLKSADRSEHSRPVVKLNWWPCHGQIISPIKFTVPLLNDSPLCEQESWTTKKLLFRKTMQSRLPWITSNCGMFSFNRLRASSPDEKTFIHSIKFDWASPYFFSTLIAPYPNLWRNFIIHCAWYSSLRLPPQLARICNACYPSIQHFNLQQIHFIVNFLTRRDKISKLDLTERVNCTCCKRAPAIIVTFSVNRGSGWISTCVFAPSLPFNSSK